MWPWLWKMLTIFFLLISENNAWCHLNIVALFYCPHWFYRLLCCHPSLQVKTDSLSGSLDCFENGEQKNYIFNGINWSSLLFFKGHIKLTIAGHRCIKRRTWWTSSSYYFPELCYFLAKQAFLCWRFAWTLGIFMLIICMCPHFLVLIFPRQKVHLQGCHRARQYPDLLSYRLFLSKKFNLGNEFGSEIRHFSRE